MAIEHLSVVSASQNADVPRMRRQRVFRAACELADEQAGVISLDQLRGLGVTRAQVRAQVAARRWRRIHTLVVATHTGPLGGRARWWAAVLEGGPQAYLDGASALVAEGLKGFEVGSIRVSVPASDRARRPSGVTMRRTRRHDPSVVLRTGIPRTSPPVAAVRGALWAQSDKQAVLLLTMCVQQGLATAEQVGLAALAVRRDRRRNLVHGVVLDLLDGVRALSEAEFARECELRGLPAPSRQVRRQVPGGSVYLDAYWEKWGVVVEIDGIQHTWAASVVGDALRQNSITLARDVVLRLPLLGLRLAPDEFFAQIEQALRDRGCPLVATSPDPASGRAAIGSLGEPLRSTSAGLSW
ncbi:MAG: hypothetical protein V9F00_02980 [Nocardioides sp.]